MSEAWHANNTAPPISFMSRNLLITSLIGCILLSASGNQAAVYDIYIAAGQSNMDGRAYTSELTGSFAHYAFPQPEVLLHYTNPRDPNNDSVTRPTYQPAGWVSLQPGYAIPPSFPAGGPLPTDRFGPAVSFGKAVAEGTTDRKVAILQVSRGNTSLASNWDPSDGFNGDKGFMYKGFETAVPQAIQAYRQWAICRSSWHDLASRRRRRRSQLFTIRSQSDRVHSSGSSGLRLSELTVYDWRTRKRRWRLKKQCETHRPTLRRQWTL